MTDYPLRGGGVCVNGLLVAGIYHAGQRIGLTHDGALLVPSGKNLLNYGVAQAGHMIASVIDNGGLRVATTAPMNSWIGFRWKADIAPELHEGDKLTLSLEDGDTLNGICFQVFFYDAAGKMLQRATFTKDNITSLKSLTVPAGAMTYDTCVFTYGKLSESTTSILHPQLELGDKRTCWEPPEKLRGGGVAADLNLCGAWDNWGTKFPTWEVSGHTAHVARPDTATGWQVRRMSAVTLPAGTYSVRVDITGTAGLAFEVHVGGRVAFYAGSDWRRFTLDQPTEVYVQLAVRPTWTGEATLTPVILEGDWTTT